MHEEGRQYQRQKIATEVIIPGSLRESEYVDFVSGTMHAKLEAYLLARQKQTQSITVKAPRPTFLDWLFRRRRTVTANVDIMAVLKNPPAVDKSETLFFEQSVF